MSHVTRDDPYVLEPAGRMPALGKYPGLRYALPDGDWYIWDGYAWVPDGQGYIGITQDLSPLADFIGPEALPQHPNPSVWQRFRASYADLMHRIDCAIEDAVLFGVDRLIDALVTPGRRLVQSLDHHEEARMFQSGDPIGYVLAEDGRTPVPTHDIHAWGAIFRDGTVRQVALFEAPDGSFVVSTVFLALDHNYSDSGPPVLWESMIFGGPLDQYMARYTTYDEAETGHCYVLSQAIAQYLLPRVAERIVTEDRDVS